MLNMNVHVTRPNQNSDYLNEMRPVLVLVLVPEILLLDVSRVSGKFLFLLTPRVGVTLFLHDCWKRCAMQSYK